MKTRVKSIIVKHYKPSNKKFKTRGWEHCGNEIYSFIRDETDKIKAKGLMYFEECKRVDSIYNEIEKEYESYFCFTDINGRIGGYDWINGNNKLKELFN